LKLVVRIWFCALLLAPAVHAQEWPRVPLPKDLQVFDVGQQITLNGSPMRLQGFVSPATPDQLVELFRQTLGKPLAETSWGKLRILGRAQGDFYISVQVEASGNGSRGTTAVTHLKAAYESREDTQVQREQWLSRLLPGSRLLSLVASQDGTKLSRHMVFANDHGETLNRDRLMSMLREEGLAFEREGRPGNDASAGTALFFKGGDKEALATIHRDSDGKTTVVLNVVTQTGHPQ
jgi:hypothetical protein